MLWLNAHNQQLRDHQELLEPCPGPAGQVPRPVCDVNTHARTSTALHTSFTKHNPNAPQPPVCWTGKYILRACKPQRHMGRPRAGTPPCLWERERGNWS